MPKMKAAQGINLSGIHLETVNDNQTRNEERHQGPSNQHI